MYLKTSLLHIAAIFLLVTISFINANAQFEFNHIENLERLKSGTTYITMKDPESEVSKEYVEIFKKYWTQSKIEFIKHRDIPKHISEESSFFTITGKVETIYETGKPTSTRTWVYLELWITDAEYFTKKNKKPFADHDQVQLARIELFVDAAAKTKPQILFTSEYDGGGHIYNWGPGVVKNYVQQLMLLINAGKKVSLYSRIPDKVQLDALKGKTLYIPQYVMDNAKKGDAQTALAEYKYEYELISSDSLNNMILEETTPLYYMLYVISYTDKYVTVINSKSGEIIYASYMPVSYFINPGDFKSLNKKMNPK